MNFLFLMDPLETVAVSKDTSFIFMVGAHRRGHEVFYLPSGGISIDHGQPVFDVVSVVPDPELGAAPAGPFQRGAARSLQVGEVDAIFIRSDPPFDQQYLMNTWLLDHVPARVPVINSPAGVRTVNEKVWSVQFTELMPPTVITRSHRRFEDFRADQGRVIAKPTDGKGGEGVFLIDPGDKNAAVIFETLSHNGRREVMVQAYLPQATEGDKRIILLDGEPIGALLRLHSKDDHRNNFFAGGKPLPVELNARDLQIVAELKPHFKRLGLHFVGIDIIGDCLIEVNVTSPTCVQEINRLYDVRLEEQVVEYVERLVEAQRVVT
ncbi:MAG: glutathione synthase [Phycisphaerae bacterium]|nr:glutathione synthase [Phycisphaerae bacterium]